MNDSHALLRRRIALIERGTAAMTVAGVPTGHAGIDRALGGGLPRGELHELYATEPGDAGSVAGFAAVLARLLGGETIWLREDRAHRVIGKIHAPGLAEIGLDPVRLTLGLLPDAAAVLRAAADAMRCTGLGATVIELWGNPAALDLTASRRLALAAEASGVTALMLRVTAAAEPSSARTRWRIAAAPSAPMAANAPGHCAWEIELMRQRGRPAGGCWRVEWDPARAELRDRTEHAGTTISGAVASLSAHGSVAADTGLRHAG